MILFYHLAVLATGTYALPGGAQVLEPRLLMGPGPALPTIDGDACTKLMPDGSDPAYSMDCVLAISMVRAPAVCTTNPEASECILNYLGAFCGDVVPSRKAANSAILPQYVGNALENCARRIALGPCVANPTGAACKSNLFAGIKFPVDPGEKATGKRAATDNSNLRSADDMAKSMREFMPGEKAKDHIFEELIIGAVKWFCNDVTAMVKGFFHYVNPATWCHGLAKALGSDVGYKRCVNVWQPGQVSPYKEDNWNEEEVLAYDNKIQQAGGVVGMIIMTLLAIKEAVVAVRYLSIEAWLLLKPLFKAPKAAELTIAGKIFRGFTIMGEGTGEATGTLEIYKLGDDGTISLYATEKDAMIALDEALESGFVHCVDGSLMPKIRRMDKRAPPDLLRVACNVASSSETVPDQWSKEAAAVEPGLELPPMLSKDMVVPRSVHGDWVVLAKDMHSKYLDLVDFDKPHLPSWGEELEAFAGAWYQKDPLKIANAKMDFIEKYNIIANNKEALRYWKDQRYIFRLRLNRVFEKIPDYNGICEVHLRLDQKTIDMLVKNKPGVRGAPGFYDVRDLITNLDATDFGAKDQTKPVRTLLSATPGLEQYRGPFTHKDGIDHTFVILSSFGKWVTPLTNGEMEIMFMDQAQGRFRLLGWAKGSTGQPEVFYFHNGLLPSDFPPSPDLVPDPYIPPAPRTGKRSSEEGDVDEEMQES